MQWLEELARNQTLLALGALGGAVGFIALIVGWVRNAFGIPARVRAWVRGKPYARQDVTAFEVIRDPGQLLPRLFGAPPPGAFGDLDMPYTPRDPNRDVQAELRRALDAHGKLLVVAPSGYGKTREAGMLVDRLIGEGYSAVLVRGEGWLDVPSDWPRGLPNNRIVIVLDDLNRLLPPVVAEQAERETRDPAVRLPTYEERLARFLRYFEQTAADVRVVATARNDVDPASGVDHRAELRARMKAPLWAEFARVELSAFPDEARRRLLRGAVDAAGVEADDEAVRRCAAMSDGNPRTIQTNVQRCRRDREPLQPEGYTPTLAGSWEARYQAVIRRYPAAAVIYDAIGLLQSAGVTLEAGRVEAVARMLCGGWLQRAWMGLPIRRASRFLQRGEINLTQTRAGRPAFAPADGQVIPSGRDLALAAHAGRLVRLFGRRGDLPALMDLGAAAYFAGLKAEALAAYDRALALDPNLVQAHYNRGVVLDDLGRTAEALAAYDRALEINPQYAQAHSNRGNVLAALGRVAEAEEAYRSAIRLAPEDPGMYAGLILLLRLQGRAREALPLAEKRLSLDPGNGNILLALASMHRHLGNRDEAARYAAEARARIPADDHYNLACLESVCGNVDAALAHLRRAAGNPDFDRDWARRDPDFEWIRDDPRFGEFSA
ncbi:MAG: tetratricopeptide repeat protein [Anaerolineae bacterium]|nr:tetratricopeptide repeat protein [Anaerolineae bacterium]